MFFVDLTSPASHAIGRFVFTEMSTQWIKPVGVTTTTRRRSVNSAFQDNEDKVVGVDQSRPVRCATHSTSSEHRRGVECVCAL
ncbi:hypothetical protein Y032_0013g2179 [Ancylostoma ceylanicum]|uniref:Uncharacterized protein n=1 Tax=Ancylostoma ceylanicum TaxID=53326 RepID=A0A016VBW5_9BILA|nr:hypothetical protein Y032_0013g2179 [Ancylostoma ceylanicum]